MAGNLTGVVENLRAAGIIDPSLRLVERQGGRCQLDRYDQKLRIQVLSLKGNRQRIP